ncbi:MAG: SDR family oxidoreductase [Myxococcales bacterium]|nr:SDR family oxidoreductase [Myxococcales bacterium]
MAGSTHRRAVITGGAGFVGSTLARRMHADGWHVVVVDNLCTGSAYNIADLVQQERFEFVQANVSEGLDISGSVDAVLHFASPASPPEYLALPIETMKVGSIGTFNALELARANGATFLMASTSEIYGDPEVHPQIESYWGNVNTIGPRSVYDEAKRFSEAATMAWHRTHGVDTRIIRIFNTYGPGMQVADGRVVPNFICQALRGEALTIYGDGSQTRSFCFVEDLVSGILAVLEHGDAQPYNLGNPVEFTIGQFAELVTELVGGQAVVYQPLPEDDPKRRQPNIDRAKRELGWQPEVDVAAGLVPTIAYFRERLGL